MPVKNSTTAEKLGSLRKEFNTLGVDGFLIPRADEFQGEYVPACASRLEWLTGFSGSAGISIVLKDKAVVMSDGRYSIQIKQETDPAHFTTEDSTLVSAGQWLAGNAAKDSVIGYDPRLHTPGEIERIEKAIAGKGIALKALDKNAVDQIWDDRPPAPKEKVELFPESVAGESVKNKIKTVIEAVELEGAQGAVLTMPDSVCWLLNIRGDDVPCTPVVLSHVIVNAGEKKAEFFVDPAKLPTDVKAKLEKDVTIYTPEDLAARLVALAASGKAAGKPVLVDYQRSAIWFKSTLESAGAIVKNAKDPCIDPRAQKTPSEQDAIRKAHVLDGIAVTKFLHWLDGQDEKSGLDEIAVADRLEAFRKLEQSYRGPSFATISGFEANGAVVHYHASAASNKKIDRAGMLLVDSGGQYEWGTTDITRTLVIGAPSEEMRENYTLVLKGHIALANAKFPSGKTGAQIDTLARQYLWAADLDFDHGTGHGVGCYLSVHEEAASISPRGHDAFKEGMLLSNEPGYYKEGEYGIRLENLILVQKDGLRKFKGTVMLAFETVTFAPFDRKLIKPDLLNVDEKTWLNDYHAQVYAKLEQGLDQDCKDWLKIQTQPF